MREEKLPELLLIMATGKTERDTVAEVDPMTHGDRDPLPTSSSSDGALSPSLAVLLACREMTPPGAMEHEKAILVMREHDYAAVPGITQLAPLLQHLTFTTDTPEATRHSNPPTAETKPSLVRKNHSKSLLQNVWSVLQENRRDMLLEREESSHFKSMVSLQSTLIHELQEQVHIRDVESSTIHREKEQLEARLERMERRLSILQKRSRDRGGETSQTSDEATPSDVSTPPNRIQCAKPDSVTRLTRSDSTSSSPSRQRSRSRSSSIEPSTGRRSSKYLMPTNSLEVTHRASIKRVLESDDHRNNKRARLSAGEKKQIESYLTTDIAYCGLGLEIPCSTEEQKETFIKVPTWEKSQISTSLTGRNSSSVDEDTSDEAFTKRHSKHETDEKRRKRWDAQRIREQTHHEQLLKRYMMKEGLPTQERKKDKIVTFQPKPEDLEGIEITHNVVVSAFGRPLPKTLPSSFNLDNFNPHTAASKGGRGKYRSRVSASFSNNSINEGGHVT